MSILESIDSPADLKRVPVDQLPLLAEEIREQIISVTSAVGGHLSSNLGVVEITLALHYLLDTPKDKIVWRSEEHTSELQSRLHLVCRLLLEKKKKISMRQWCRINLRQYVTLKY